jgi:hypothetical protein
MAFVSGYNKMVRGDMEAGRRREGGELDGYKWIRTHLRTEHVRNKFIATAG